MRDNASYSNTFKPIDHKNPRRSVTNCHYEPTNNSKNVNGKEIRRARRRVVYETLDLLKSKSFLKVVHITNPLVRFSSPNPLLGKHEGLYLSEFLACLNNAKRIYWTGADEMSVRDFSISKCSLFLKFLHGCRSLVCSRLSTPQET